MVSCLSFCVRRCGPSSSSSSFYDLVGSVLCFFPSFGNKMSTKMSCKGCQSLTYGGLRFPSAGRNESRRRVQCATGIFVSHFPIRRTFFSASSYVSFFNDKRRPSIRAIDRCSPPLIASETTERHSAEESV